MPFFQKFALKNVPIPPMSRIGPGRIVMDLFALFSTVFKIQGHEINDQYHYNRNKNISYLEIWSLYRGRGYKGLSANFGGSPNFRCYFCSRWRFKKDFWWFPVIKVPQICPNIADFGSKSMFYSYNKLIWPGYNTIQAFYKH